VLLLHCGYGIENLVYLLSSSSSSSSSQTFSPPYHLFSLSLILPTSLLSLILILSSDFFSIILNSIWKMG
jgi:hypothetical protein